MKGIVILLCIAGVLLAEAPANAEDEKKTEQTPGVQKSAEPRSDNGNSVAPAEVKKEVVPQPSYSPGKFVLSSPSTAPSPVNVEHTAPVPSYFNYNSSNQGGEAHPGSGGGNGAEHGRSGGGYHGHGGYYENPWRNRGFRSDWDFSGRAGSRLRAVLRV